MPGVFAVSMNNSLMPLVSSRLIQRPLFWTAVAPSRNHHLRPVTHLVAIQNATCIRKILNSSEACSLHGTRRLASSAAATAPNFKRWIQPFILKCHPDMAQQQGLPKTGQKVNLKAIQSLNSYVDGVQRFLKTNKYPFSNSESSVVEIEFVMAFTRGNNQSTTTSTEITTSTNSTTGSSSSVKSPGQPITTSRRKVELAVPPPNFTPGQVTRHVQQQVIKLLKIASLPIPSSLATAVVVDDDYDYDNFGGASPAATVGPRRRPLTPWEASRQRFWRRVEWKKFDAAYQEALADAQAHMMTRNKIRNTPLLRQRLLAKILSNVSFTEQVTPLERLVAYRRLLRLLDDNFDALHLEDFGTFWEDQMSLVVTEARPYNTSSSAMRKRRQRHLETGYSFTIHHNNRVTVSIPIDFLDSELMQELARNIIDFVEWTSSSNDNSPMGAGIGIFESTMKD
jgi:hypothetical protein